MPCFITRSPVDLCLGGTPTPPAFSPRDIDSLLQFALEPSQDAYYGTTLDGVHYLASRESYGTWRAPREGRCWLFDGSNDYATTSNLNMMPPSITVAFSIVRTGANNFATIFGKASASDWSVRLDLSSGGQRVRGYVNNGSGGVVTVSDLTDLPLNTLTKFVFTYDGSTAKLYREGTLVNSTSGSVVPQVQNTPFVIGGSASGLPLSGMLSDIRIYSVP